MMRVVRYLAILVAVLILGWAVAHLIGRAGKTAVKIQVVPAAATVTVDGAQTSATTVYLPRGQHRFEAQLAGFTSETEAVAVGTNPATVQLTLNPNSQQGIDYLNQHPKDQQQRERAGGQAAASASNTISQYQSLVGQLPYDGIDFNVSYGTASGSADDGSGNIAIYVHAQTVAERQKAIAWIREQGVDPTNLEIVFSDAVNPFVTGMVGP